MAAKERAIRRPISEIGLCRSIVSIALVPVFVLSLSLRVHAQQPAQRPAPWSGNFVAPPAPILGLDDARPIMPLEFSRAWLAKVETVRLQREHLAAMGKLDGATPADLIASGAALT